MEIGPFTQSNFSGGLNLYLQDSHVADDEYFMGFNLRNRDGSIIPTRSYTKLTGAPVGKKQGLYGFDIYLVLFCAGKAYYKIVGSDTWHLISGFTMSATADRIYAQAVPASTINFKRKRNELADATGNSTESNISVDPTLNVNGTEAGLVCQDGVTQPRLILSNGNARAIQAYGTWADGAREYVPIGLQMTYLNGILFVVSPDKKKIFRSVTGRPLDFVVNIDTAGLKGGDADTTSHRVSYDDINFIGSLNTGELLVGTSKALFPVELNYNELFFGEPTFNNRPLIEAGIVNQFSMVELLGDTAFIDFNGMRSFNAVQQLNNEGRSSILSKKVEKLFVDVRQTAGATCAMVFDNYAFFAVNSSFGYLTLVYDMLSSVWCSMDFIDSVPVMQFGVVNLSDEQQIYCINSNGDVYKLYDLNQNYSAAMLFPKTRIIQENLKKGLKLKGVRTLFVDGLSEDSATVTSFIDGERKTRIVQTLRDTTGGIAFPVYYPVMFDSKSKVNNLLFNFTGIAGAGTKIGCSISWSNDARLVEFQMDAEDVDTVASQKQQQQVYL